MPTEKNFEVLVADWRKRVETSNSPVTISPLRRAGAEVKLESVSEPEQEKTLGELYQEITTPDLEVIRKYSGEKFAEVEANRFRLSSEEDRRRLEELLRLGARAPAGAKVEDGFESIITIVIDALWYIHMYHVCFKGAERKFQIDGAFTNLEKRVEDLLVAVATTDKTKGEGAGHQLIGPTLVPA
jgi:hypothetical protein